LIGYVGLGRIFGTPPFKIVSNDTLSAPITSNQATESPTSESLEQVPSSPVHLHMHATGQRMVDEVIRGGEVFHFHTASVEVFDFNQQGKFAFQEMEDMYWYWNFFSYYMHTSLDSV
jgi:hypothetical protein